MSTSRWNWRRIGAGLDWRIRGAYRRLRARPPAGHSFRDEILRRYGVASPNDVSDPTVRMWIDFALSTVERGREAVARMRGISSFWRRSVLDVGCAYGGFLVAAKDAGARSVTGIDINADLLGLARLLLSDYEVEATLAVDDITESDIERRLGRFDIILCNDVIEHVVDPVDCARGLSHLLKRRGVVYMEIPNAGSVEFMLSDGHYGLPGLTLLDRGDAEVWWRRTYGADEVYGVEHYAPIDYYLSIFSQNGLWIRQLNPPSSDELAGVIPRLRESFNKIDEMLGGLEEVEPVPKMRMRADEERRLYEGLARRYETSHVEAERGIIARTLVNRYERQFWTLVGVKPG